VPNGGGIYNGIGREMDPVTGLVFSVDKGWYSEPTSNESEKVTYTLKDNSDGAEAKAVYHLKYHNEWENPVDLPETSRTGTQIVGGWSTNTGTENESLVWSVTMNSSVNLSVNFGANFNVKDWVNIGGEVKASQDISAVVPTTAHTTLTPNTKARPYIRYTIRTQWKAVDHYTTSGWDPNPNRPDKKWPQGADLPIRIPADLEALWQGPIDISVPNSPDPS
jgi:hypothetical protein